LRSIYRNPLGHVLDFFKKYHDNKVKVFNLCDDSFIDVNLLTLSADIRVAYFPMADHNPGSVRLLFHFVLDLCLYLAESEDSVAAVHCKAGKGRTGVAVCCYLIFMEAAADAYEAVELFNSRRTTDGKVNLSSNDKLQGLGVAS